MSDRKPHEPQTEDSTIDAQHLSQRAALSALSKKAEEIVILDVRKSVSYCDFFVIANGTNRRQVRAIAEAVRDDLAMDPRSVPMGIEGLEACRWVLIDYGDVIVHVFDQELRTFYDLDGLWIDAPRMPIDESTPVSQASVS